jgi:predicted Zn-dependent peptidase
MNVPSKYKNIHTKILNNGLRIIYEKSTNTIPITSIYVFCDVGSGLETEETRGFSHFVEHMCFKGTQKNPQYESIFTKFDNVGAYLNASTDKRCTIYKVKCSNQHLSSIFRILSDMLYNSIFDKKECEKEIKVVHEENFRDLENNYNLLYEKLETKLYENTPFQYEVDSVKYHRPLDFDKVYRFYKTFYKPQNMVLSIVSNVSVDSIYKMLEHTDFNKNQYSPECSHVLNEIKHSLFIPPEIKNESKPTYMIHPIKNTQEIYLGISFRVCSQYSEDIHKLHLLKRLLGDFFSSRMTVLLREENGLTYESSVNTEFYENAGDFTITALTEKSKFIKNGKKKGVLPLIISMLNDLIKNGITQKELTLTKNYTEGAIELNMEKTNISCNHNGLHMLLYPNMKTFVPYHHLFDVRYQNITKKEINEVIRKYFTKSNMFVCVLGENLPSDRIIQTECERLI